MHGHDDVVKHLVEHLVKKEAQIDCKDENGVCIMHVQGHYKHLFLSFLSFVPVKVFQSAISTTVLV